MGASGTKARRSWLQRAVIAFNVCVIVIALGTATVFGYVNNKLSDVQRLALSGVLTEPDASPGAPQNFLIAGIDSDVGLSSNDPAVQGRGAITGARGDTIMILHVNPSKGSASLLSLPRDLWVKLAGQSTHGRINAALGLGGGGVGGAETLISTIEQNFQIPINHYVEIDFAAFEKLIGAVGGIPIYFNTGIRDYDPSGTDGIYRHTAIHIPGPGCYTLDPEQALAYARSRHMQYQRVPGDSSTWMNDNGNDFGRIQRQQDFIRRVMHRAIQKGVRDPRVMNNMVNALVSSVRMDGKLSVGAILDLGRTFRSFDPDELKTSQLPVSGLVINGAAVLKPKMPEAESALAPFRNISAQADEAARSVSVEVHNGTGRPNEATNVSRALERVGFQTVQPSDELGVTHAASIIRYGPGQEAQARLLARHLQSDVVYEMMSAGSHDEAEAPPLVLVTGTSFTGVLTKAKPKESVAGPSTTTSTSTTSTVPSATSSTSASPSTTSTVPGYLPGPPPPGKHCG